MSRQNWNDDHSELEAELRRDRPTPRSTFLQTLRARIEDVVGASKAPKVSRPSRPRLRFGLAVGFATVFLAAFASLGGVGYANSSLRTLSEGAPNLFSHLVHGNLSHTKSSSSEKGNEQHGSNGGEDDNGDDEDDSAEHQYPHIVSICLIKKHGEIQILVPQRVANKLIGKGKAHLPPCATHGDD